MSTTLRASSTNTFASATAITVAAPTGTLVGDLSIVIVHANAVVTIVDNNGTTPWTEDVNDYAASTSGTVSVFSRKLITGDPTTYAFTIGSAQRCGIVALTYKNPKPTYYDVTPVTGDFSVASVSTGTTATLTTLSANAIHVAVMCQDAATNPTTSQPAGYNVDVNLGSNQAICVCSKVIAVPAAAGAQTFGWATAAQYNALSFALADNVAAVAPNAGRPFPFAPSSPSSQGGGPF